MTELEAVKDLTPLKAVRKFCLRCSCLSSGVKHCSKNACAFYVLRFGRMPKPICGIGISVLNRIKIYCFDCVYDNRTSLPTSTHECIQDNCPVWGYRHGHNPKQRRKYHNV